MAVLVQSMPLECAPLLTNPAPLAYNTMSKPRITVDTRQLFALPPMLNMDSVQGNSRAGFEDSPIMSATSSTRSPNSACCEFCRQHNMAHRGHLRWTHRIELPRGADVDLEANSPERPRQCRLKRIRDCCSAETLMPAIEFFIKLQMRLLAILVPLLLLTALYVFLRQAPQGYIGEVFLDSILQK